MAVYTPVLTYTFRDTLGNTDPNKVIKGAYLDGEFNAIHTASLDAASLSGSNAFTSASTFTGGAGPMITVTAATNGIAIVGTSGSGLSINGGAGVSTKAYEFLQGTDGSSNASYFYCGVNAFSSDGSFDLGHVANTGLNVKVAGNTSVTASSGTAFVVNGAPGTSQVVNFRTSQLDGIGAVFGRSGGTNNPDITLRFTESTNKSTIDFNSTTSTPNGSISVNGTDVITLSTAGNVVTAAPATGVGITSNGASGSQAINVLGSSTSGQSYGVSIEAGTTSGDYAIQIQNQAATTTYFKVRGDGALQGYGTTAAALVDMTPDIGSFTPTYTGFSAAPTGAWNWIRIGKFVLLTTTNQAGTSNGTTFSITNLPGAITPVTIGHASTCAAFGLIDGSANIAGGAALVSWAGSVTFYKDGTLNGSGWTNSGTKGFGQSVAIMYSIV